MEVAMQKIDSMRQDIRKSEKFRKEVRFPSLIYLSGMRMDAPAPSCAGGGWRTAGRSRFSPPTVWVSGIEAEPDVRLGDNCLPVFKNLSEIHKNS